jgi:hypothetical protein
VSHDGLLWALDRRDEANCLERVGRGDEVLWSWRPDGDSAVCCCASLLAGCYPALWLTRQPLRAGATHARTGDDGKVRPYLDGFRETLGHSCSSAVMRGSSG